MKTEEVILPEVPAQWLDESGMINDDGRRMLAALIEKMPPGEHQIKNPRPGDPDVYAVYMAKAKTAASVELILRHPHNKRLLLTWRNKDDFWEGWHFPGTYIAPGETFEEALSRCALRELGMSVKPQGLIGVVNHPRSKRFHDVSNLFLCDLANPDAWSHTLGNNPSWMNPLEISEKNLIPPHRPYLKAVTRAVLMNQHQHDGHLGWYQDNAE